MEVLGLLAAPTYLQKSENNEVGRENFSSQAKNELDDMTEF